MGVRAFVLIQTEVGKAASVAAQVREIPGVVAADEEVGQAVVAAVDGMEDRFARAGVSHRGREAGEQDAVGGEVVVEQHPVAGHARRRRNVVRLRRTDQWVQERSVERLERDLDHVLVGAVQRVARLERDDAVPAPVGEGLARLAHAWYHKFRVLGEPEEAARLVLARAVRQVLANGLTLLGIHAPDRM